MKLYETELTDAVLAELIRLSEAWAAEDSCFGYRLNERADIEGNRIFLAEDADGTAGYLFGKIYPSVQMKSVMPAGTPYFEVEEIYVVPEKRSRGIGRALFRFAEQAVKADADYIVLSTATRNWKAVFRFYLDELDMRFWSARLFKKI